MLPAEIKMVMLTVDACLVTLVLHLTADLNVPSMQTVQVLSIVGSTSVPILVWVFVVKTLSVLFKITMWSANVWLDTSEIHLPYVPRNPRFQGILASLTLVDAMPFPNLLATDVFVNVNVNTLEILSRDVDENVKFIETVLRPWLVKIISASIPVIGEFVASMLSAEYKITMQFALASQDTLAIHSTAAILVSTIE